MPANPAFDPLVAEEYSARGYDPLAADMIAGGKLFLNPSQYDPSSAQFKERYGPTSGSSYLENLAAGAQKKVFQDWPLAGAQIYSSVSDLLHPNQSSIAPILQQQAEESRQQDLPLMQTAGGKLGAALPALPMTLAPGANTVAGAGVLGGLLGAAEPITQDDSRLMNTGMGTLLGMAGQKAGSSLGSWATNRAKQPFLGYYPEANDRIAAEAVGSSAPRLNDEAIGTRLKELGGIFDRARSPNVTADLRGSPTAVDSIRNEMSNLDASALAPFDANRSVQDFLNHATSPKASIDTETLGNLATRLRQAKEGQLYSASGNRVLGNAYGSLQKHVEDLIQGSIRDPAQASEYSLARQQYGILQDLRWSPNLLKASTGHVNPTALGDYLQRNQSSFSTGANQSELYKLAKWGQATGEGKPPPAFELSKPWQPLAYYSVRNPASRVIGGVASRAGRPVAGLLGPASQAGTEHYTPAIASGLERFAPRFTGLLADWPFQ